MRMSRAYMTEAWGERVGMRPGGVADGKRPNEAHRAFWTRTRDRLTIVAPRTSKSYPYPRSPA